MIATKTSPGSCIGKPQASGGLMHLTATGLPALGCEMHQTPSAWGFPTQLPGSILIPMGL